MQHYCIPGFKGNTVIFAFKQFWLHCRKCSNGTMSYVSEPRDYN